MKRRYRGRLHVRYGRMLAVEQSDGSMKVIAYPSRFWSLVAFLIGVNS